MLMPALLKEKKVYVAFKQKGTNTSNLEVQL